MESFTIGSVVAAARQSNEQALDQILDNMAVAADDPGRCVAVYEWDMCTRGDPLCDLGS